MTEQRRPIPVRIRRFAKEMRRSPTDAEAAMWRLLRNRRLAHFKFRRQVPFQSYILDFVCFGRRLVVEIDGGQHSQEVDGQRDDRLSVEGFRVARYWNNDVLQNPSGVLEDLLVKLGDAET
jgi:very-short-patch-repair endonuclease